jgi:TPR repeat protein
MYAEGRGVPKNSAEAVRLFRLADEQENAEAACQLGEMYAKGEGVAQDLVQAHALLSKAVVRGDVGSDLRLKALESKLSLAQLSEATARLRQRLLESKQATKNHQ